MRGVFSHEKQRTQTDSGMAKAMPLSVPEQIHRVSSARGIMYGKHLTGITISFLLSSGSFLSLSLVKNQKRAVLQLFFG